MVKSKEKLENITLEKKNLAEQQISDYQKRIDFDTKDYTIELLVDKFKKKEFFVPDYQRNFIWNDKDRNLFIESLLLGLPIPFMFLANCSDGRLEIIDGAQRMYTITAFFENKLRLNKLEKLTALQGFTFSDLPESRQRKFKNQSLRVIVLEENTPEEYRQDLFYRINTAGIKAKSAEIRRGSYKGSLTKFIEECSEDILFKKLAPISEKREKQYERQEFVLRFFAYLNNYQNFGHRVTNFLDEYLVKNMETFDRSQFLREFNDMLHFVENNFPFGFAKSRGSKSTPRVRFEAISVGVGLALRINPNLNVDNVNWINSEEFRSLTTSDASNNEGRLKNRVEYVRDQLLGFEE